MRFEWFVAALLALLVMSNVITTWLIHSEDCPAPQWNVLK